ncbi:MAG: hypothetical protein ACO3NL_03480, partial [Phycisphaerales bacterium]
GVPRFEWMAETQGFEASGREGLNAPLDSEAGLSPQACRRASRTFSASPKRRRWHYHSIRRPAAALR